MFLGKPNSHIILALDTESKAEAIKVLDQTHDLIDVIKFNYPLILKEGLSLISEIKQRYGLKILADFKVADVPVTNNRIVELVKKAGADAIMVHGFIGTDALLEIMNIANNEIGVIIVTELTHPGGLEFTRPYSIDFANICSLIDAYGIQAPGTRPDQINQLRNTIGEKKTIVSCGVGAQGGDFREVLNAGADFAIIGRAIYNAPNPREVVLNLRESVNV
ncbi:orotidine-5'-phosphate decarboxylase [Lysinibacillus telephonicus]|uniref:Orotidine 5'-phosphate decarboxylase n=1 Tax=Lysinibacillus telephonicus TaxID=1714840 RepID=A0A3S0HK83_9BACI|nr:orotidine-5'-phosphate decarboxylase [Lysinibacillus telephonicus]RTQ94325.1 orotidine-5'-phosphate decarboxylase [Lysinibacillus telephonicus]